MTRIGNIIVLGMFDGVHIGHAQLFSKARALKAEYNMPITAYTFQNHPIEFITGEKVASILTNTERISKLYKSGADKVIAEEFSYDMCNMSAESFAQMLKSCLGAEHLVVGFNYTFGKDSAGTPEVLCKLGKKYGFAVHVTEPVMYGGEVVSSSRIRQAISNGNMKDTNIMLGSNFMMSGTVVRCREVGRQMGFPTANIKNSDNKPTPLFGVYATRTYINSKVHNSITNVGTNPTFGEMELSVETHIFDFDEDIYDKQISVEYVDFIRKQRRFASMNDLSAQINEDCKSVRKLFDNIYRH